jgi:hypothetical protein
MIGILDKNDGLCGGFMAEKAGHLLIGWDAYFTLNSCHFIVKGGLR